MAEITPEDLNGFRFIKFLNVCGRRVLYKTFCCGTPDKPPDITLEQYLNNLGTPGKFNKTQQELINKSPDGSKFDVSLLFLSIKLACKNVAGFNDTKWKTPSSEMEYYVTAIKDTRNDALHGQLAITDNELLEKTEELKELLIGCLKTSGERYGRDEAEVNKEIKQVDKDLDNIKQEILGEEDIIKYCSDKMQQLMIENSSETLKKIYQNTVFINPASSIIENLRLEVDKIFVDIEVKQGNRRGEGEHVDYRDLLKLVQSPHAPPSTSAASKRLSARPQILLLEGVAGSGKTTLVKMITQDWIKEGQGKIKGLDNYDLMLWVQCRDSTMKSYQDLLDRLMPDVSLKFRNLLPRLMKLCKLLIIVDGLDEINNNSRILINSLLHELNNSHTTFLCTSRPEKLEMFKMTIPEEYYVTNAEIRGIRKHLILEFLCLSHQEIEKQTKSKRSTEQLVKAVEKLEGLQEHLSLPMNLIFVVIMWDQEPDELNLATITQTELYNKIHHLCQRRLLERLANHPQTNAMTRDDLEDGIQDILIVIYRTALVSLSRDQLILEEEFVKKIKQTCKDKGLPHEELLSAFLSLKPTWTWEGVQEQYSAPHKGIQDYYSAVHIVTTLKCQLQSPASPGSIREVLTQTITPAEVDMAKYQNVLVHVAGLLHLTLDQVAKVDMAKYQNVLVHVAGLLHLTLDQVPEALAREVVDLLHESGMTDQEQWLDLLENTKVTPVTAEAVAPFINTRGDIDIGDNRVGSYVALLPHLEPCRVSVIIMSDPDDLPHLPDLLAGLARHHCVRLYLLHHYIHDDTTTSDDLLQRVPPRSDLKVFWGRLSGDGVAALPPSLEKLHLSVVSDDHARCLLPQLHAAVTSRLPRLGLLQVRVAAGVSPAVLVSLPRPRGESLVPLPRPRKVDLVPLPMARRKYLGLLPRPRDVPRKVHLVLSGVSDAGVSDAGVSRACDVASKLQPPGGYTTIGYTDNTLTAAGCQDLILGLQHRGVKVEVLLVRPSDTITRHQRNQLKTLAKTTLQCDLYH